MVLGATPCKKLGPLMILALTLALVCQGPKIRTTARCRTF